MNKEQHVLEFIPDFLIGNFDSNKRAAIQSHLQVCELCRREYETIAMLWNSLGELPAVRPSTGLHERFNAMLAAYEHGLHHAKSKTTFVDSINVFIEIFWPKQAAIQFAIALLLFAGGGFIGMQVTRPTEQKHRSESNVEIAELRGEVQAMNRMLAVSLMQQQSASERLRGITLTSQFPQADGELTSALFEALNYDPNVNVRLAAVDALQQFGNDPAIRKGIIDALKRQKSPIIQMALIDASVSLQVLQTKPVMQELLKDTTLNVAVKSRIAFALNELES
ncbi:MAG: HEAT repeat domain-containing protein [Ignavibacteriales bacterium]|nr:HEAT repeat domain-containing protein [Ignavibacteriales bacterium]